MKTINYFKDLTKFERVLWIGSLIIILTSYILAGANDYLTLIASLIGATALIFVAKGYVLGQVLTVLFAVFYGIISYYFKYYGEMITYLGMTAPIAIIAIITWVKHPYGKSKEVAVAKMTKSQILIMIVITVAVTTVFYYILKALNNANLLVSTISIATSFLASYLAFMRSPYYALAYSFNDIVLIVMWILACKSSISYVTMVACFVVFLINDFYGLYNWLKMRSRQNTAHNNN